MYDTSMKITTFITKFRLVVLIFNETKLYKQAYVLRSM